MRVNTGRKWRDLGPRKGEVLAAATFQFRDGEVVGSIDSAIIAEGHGKRTAGVDRPRQIVVR